MRKLAFGLSALVLIIISFFVVTSNFNAEKMYQPRNEKSMVHNQSVSGAAEWLANRRINLETKSIDYKHVENARQQVIALKSQKDSGLGLQWEYMGPDNIGGRCRAILIDPSNPKIIYAGGVSGGLWKSETAGGSWRQIIYAGDEETDGIPNLNISNICRAANGDIYFGTGEGFYIGQGTGSRGFEGAGIWKSTDGENFNRLTSTWSDSESKNTFVFVNKLAAHPTNENKIYAATYRGLRITSDGGQTWENPILNVAGAPVNEFTGDVKISSDGKVVIAKVGASVYVSHNSGDLNTWEKVSGGTDQLPTASRIEFAIAPSNSNYIYAQASKSNGQLLNVYKSDDGGYTWSIIGPGGGTDFNPLGDQGTFNNTIHVFPDDHNQLILGGQYSIWTWGKTLGWDKKSFWNFPKTDLRYVHADQHEIRFDPTNPNTIYVGSDGGVSRSLDRGITWQTRNKFFGVTQFYAIGFGPKGSIIGGTQDNGTIYWDKFIPPTTGLNYEYKEVSGGDGGYSEISQLNPNFLFSTVYYGTLYRSNERGAEGTVAPFYSSRMYNDQTLFPGDESRGHAFVTPIALWESFYDENSIDSTMYSPTFDIPAGATIQIESNVSGLFYEQYLEEEMSENDTIWVKDTYQANLAVGFRGSIWVTNHPMNVRQAPVWFPVLRFEEDEENPNTYESTQHLEWSADGNTLYAVVENVSNGFINGSSLYRISGFNENRTNASRDFDDTTNYNLDYARIASFNNRIITGITVDPEFAGNVVITLGNYGSSNFVYHSTSANTAEQVSYGSAGTFQNKQGNLPQMPVYDALILWNDSKKVIVGTEFGVYSTLDITAANPVWYDENDSFDYVPTYSLRQQHHRNGWVSEISRDSGVENHGHIWAGTHGRGVYRTTQFAGPVNIGQTNIENKLNTSLNIYPNPASENINIEINLKNKSNANIEVYDLQGKLVHQVKFANLQSGKTIRQLNINDFTSGIYLIKMTANNEVATKRLIVQ